MFGKEPWVERDGNQGELVERLVKFCAERDQRGYRLERLVIEDPLDPPPDLSSLLAPYVDHFEIKGENMNDDDIWELEFGSRQAFDFPRARECISP